MMLRMFWELIAPLMLTQCHVVHSTQYSPPQPGGNPSSATCVDDSQPQPTTYWTDWYSSYDSLTDVGEMENFTQVCSTTIIETECREKYTHHSLLETGLSFTTPCEDGVLVCENSLASTRVCVDMELRLNCTTPPDPLPEPDFHWSLSELDTGNTLGAPEPWVCDDGTLVQQVDPIRGNIYGYVRGGDGLKKRYSPVSQITRCAVRTNGLSSLAFEPFVRSCLTDRDCYNTADGITVSFWFYKVEMQKNEPRPQTIPLHVFRSPYLLATMQEGNLTVTYHHGSKTSIVRAEIEESAWRFVTVTYDPDTDLKVYINKADVGMMVSDPTPGAWPSLAEFEAANASFQVFRSEDGVNVTSSDIRPIGITDLKIFYVALSPEDVERLFVTVQNEDLPAKVIRMSTSRKQFLDYVTQENVDHIWLKCLIRVHKDARLIVRFMFTDDLSNEPFREMKPDIFKMRTYRKQHSSYRHTVVAQIFGRHDGQALPRYYTCDPVSDSSVSGYGYNIIGIHSTTEIVEATYYWTRFFDYGPPNDDGVEDESKTSHEELANADGYDLLCNDPVYAECRVKATSSGGPSVPWYDANATFVPQYDYPCDKNGIRCSPQDEEGTNQTCPDLEVRYACIKPGAAQPTVNGGEDPGAGPNQPSGNNDDPNPSFTAGQPGSSPQQPPSSNDNLTSGPNTTPPAGGQQSGGASETKRNTKNSFTNVIKNNLNWIYPVAIVVFGTGIPIIIACYFLCRKKTPEEIEAQRLVAEKEAANRPMSAREKR